MVPVLAMATVTFMLSVDGSTLEVMWPEARKAHGPQAGSAWGPRESAPQAANAPGAQPQLPPAHQQQQQHAHVDAENAALQQQLLAMGSEVAAVERSVRDVAALNQMFSAQVVHQSQQIEQLYTEVPLTPYPAPSPCTLSCALFLTLSLCLSYGNFYALSNAASSACNSVCPSRLASSPENLYTVWVHPLDVLM